MVVHFFIFLTNALEWVKAWIKEVNQTHIRDNSQHTKSLPHIHCIPSNYSPISTYPRFETAYYIHCCYFLHHNLEKGYKKIKNRIGGEILCNIFVPHVTMF